MTSLVRSAGGLSVAALLDRSSWFPALTHPARKQVQADVIERAVGAGEALVRRGDTAIGWYGVLEGLLKWSITGPEGHAVSLGGLTAASWFGEGTLLHGRPIEADIIALRHSRLALIPKETFDWLCRTEPAFTQFLLNQLNERLHWFMGDFVAHRLFSVEAQVARALVGLVHPWLQPGGDGHLQISQEELANLVGLSRQRCNRALSELKRRSLVRVEYGEIILLDLDTLRLTATE